ncbi:MAG: M20/M25/M40 family metallo-hydrolase, partial [Candidatus Methanomethylicia archaeon]
MVDVLNILKELVGIESVNDPSRSIKPSIKCVQYLESILRDIGFKSEIIESNGYYSILGYVGYGYPIVMLMAHYDTVPVVFEEWSSNPFTLGIVNNRIYGRGVFDDKGNVAAIIAALSRISFEKINGTLIYAFTGDEEIGGVNGALAVRENLKSKGLTPNYLVNGDGSDLSIIVRRRNVFNIEVTIREEVTYIRGFERSIRFNVLTPVMNTRHAAYFTHGVDTHPLIAASQYLRVNSNLIASSINGLFIKSNVIPSWVELKYVEPSLNGELIKADYALTSLVKSIIPMTKASLHSEFYSDYGVTITPNMYMYINGLHKLIL